MDIFIAFSLSLLAAASVIHISWLSCEVVSRSELSKYTWKVRGVPTPL